MAEVEYRAWDREEKLGPPPWRRDDPKLIAWEKAHEHDVRLKCYVEYGCPFSYVDIEEHELLVNEALVAGHDAGYAKGVRDGLAIYQEVQMPFHSDRRAGRRVFFLSAESTVYHVKRDCAALKPGTYWPVREGTLKSDGSIEWETGTKHTLHNRRPCGMCAR